MLRDYDEIQDRYWVNEKEYYRLIQEETPSWQDYTIWDLPYKSMSIHKTLNKLWENNPFFYRLIAEYGYENILTDKNKEKGYVGEYNQFDFDHTTTIQLKEPLVTHSDTITGILTFPYLTWEGVKEWVDKAPPNYRVYIINPVLIIYNIGAVGLLLTMDYYNGGAFELFNRYCISLCGLPLFLQFTDREKVPMIKTLDFPCSRDDFVDELKHNRTDKGLQKLINFWHTYDEVECGVLESAYKKFQHIQAYSIYTENLNHIKVESEKPFQLVHETTGSILGEYHSFILDGYFKVIDTDTGEQELTDEELRMLLDGEYDFKMV